MDDQNIVGHHYMVWHNNNRAVFVLKKQNSFQWHELENIGLALKQVLSKRY